MAGGLRPAEAGASTVIRGDPDNLGAAGSARGIIHACCEGGIEIGLAPPEGQVGRAVGSAADVGGTLQGDRDGSEGVDGPEANSEVIHRILVGDLQLGVLGIAEGLGGIGDHEADRGGTTVCERASVEADDRADVRPGACRLHVIEVDPAADAGVGAGGELDLDPADLGGGAGVGQLARHGLEGAVDRELVDRDPVTAGGE